MTLVFLKIDMQHQDPIVKGPPGWGWRNVSCPVDRTQRPRQDGCMGHGAWGMEGELGGGGGGGSERVLGLEKRVDYDFKPGHFKENGCKH